MSTIWTEEVNELMEEMPEEQQRRVAEFARSVVNRPVGVSGKSMLQFAGLIPREDLEVMERAIEEGCEQIDHASW